MHVHLPSTFPDNTHDAGMWDGALDVQGFMVQGLQFLSILLLCVHLDLKCIHLQQLCALFEILCAIWILASPVCKHKVAAKFCRGPSAASLIAMFMSAQSLQWHI